MAERTRGEGGGMLEGAKGKELGQLRVLFISGLTPGYYGQFRLEALKRLGLETVVSLDLMEYTAGRGLLAKVQHRTQMGATVRRLNEAIVHRANAARVDVVFCDKVLGLWPETLRALRKMGVLTVDFVIDNPFGPRHDPGWRVYKKALSSYDLHAVQRESSLADYRARGAQEVMLMRTSYEPTVHYPPSGAWSDRDRNRSVSFIGTPYDRRGGFLTQLWRAGIDVQISGSEPHWRAKLPRDAFAAMFRLGELKADAYREAIWRSRINLAFVTHGNKDDVAHKAFEIAACGGFLLAERTAGHMACFREDEEAVFFADEAECVEKIRRYLPDEAARRRIAAAGQQRAATSGYDNDSVLRAVLERAAELLKERRR